MKKNFLAIGLLLSLSVSVFAQQKTGLRVLSVHKIESDGVGTT